MHTTQQPKRDSNKLTIEVVPGRRFGHITWRGGKHSDKRRLARSNQRVKDRNHE